MLILIGKRLPPEEFHVRVGFTFLCLGAALLFAPTPGKSASPTEPSAKPVDFNREVRPILSDNCFFCHGPDEKHRMAGLRLDTKEGAFGKTGVIVPGDSAKSRIIRRLNAENPAAKMPPASSGKTLSAKSIAIIAKWIDEGAKWEEHWAYVAPKRPDPPAVKDAAWPRNEIDRFILARLEREGLRPSPEADKATLLRRLSYDLTGLPASPAEVEAFLADKSENAYEKQVDRLLASSRYGERMAMQWLDVARYADTHGYHIDSHRDMWPWRDWVIRAYNRNMPFDQFTMEQIAGDLLPNPTLEQRVATGFNRNHMINYEGGAIPEEYQTEYVVDRVEATSSTWLGMTMGCARCHDHKYDPIKQKDFYQFFAFFNTVDEKGLDGRNGNAEPFLQLPSASQKETLDGLKGRIDAAEKGLVETEIAALQAEWEKKRAETLPSDPKDHLLAHYELDGNFADTSGGYHHGRTLKGEVTYAEGQVARSAELNGETHVNLGAAADLERTDNFAIAAWIRASGIREMTVFSKEGADRRGYEIAFSDADPIGDLKRGHYLHVRLIHQWPGDLIEIKTKNRMIWRDWYHVTVNYDGSGKASGLVLLLNGTPAEIEVVRDSLTGSIRTEAPLEIGNKAGRPYKGQLDDLRIYSRQLTAQDLDTLVLRHPLRSVLEDNGKRSKEQRERLRDYFLTYDAPQNFRSAYAELKQAKKDLEALNKQIPNTMVMAELEKPRETFILARGDYRNKTEKVEPAVPSALPPLPASWPRNRLGLAKWLVDPSNPLTARVAVNRYWQMYFGHGIVKTIEDFGSQGEPPVHPELLDWLATEFVRTGWDVKGMQRMIVTSAAYRQASKVTPVLMEKDPENRLLARGPRFRLPAEMVRDSALLASGLLKEKQGGPSVFPYQPKGIWDDIAYGDVFSAQTYTPSSGDDLYRRSMYTFWKRTMPPPALATFDAPDREKCAARRALTNTPLQALVLLNDPTYIEASRALAEHMLRQERDADKRIAYGFRVITNRRPTGQETRVLRDLAKQQLSVYRADKKAAADLLGVGESKYSKAVDPAELAAWTMVASTMFNLDEAITKE
jgi:hypothetical protein